MQINLIILPYHYGFLQAEAGAGAGPLRYLEAGIEQRLAEQGFAVATSRVAFEPPAELTAAVVSAGKLVRQEVAAAQNRQQAPLVLGGGCSSCLGVLAALPPDTGVIWFDAHGDFNTPETTPSGFFDGMPLAVATGHAYQELWHDIAARPPVDDNQVLLAGVRDLDPGEEETLRAAAIPAISSQALQEGGAAVLLPHLQALRRHAGGVYLHFDIDVLDPSLAPAVDFRTPGGLSLDTAVAAIRLIGEQFEIRAATLTAYNPDHEEQERTLQSGLAVIDALAQAFGGQGAQGKGQGASSR
jgi:arginase